MDDLYSPVLDVRYRSSVQGDPKVLTQMWPRACGGAANAFLALIGPSRGHHTGPPPSALGAKTQPQLRPMTVGRDVMTLDWGDHRKVRWTRLCSELLGGEQYVGTLTALLNLATGSFANERDVPRERLQAGFVERVWPLLADIRPRLVVALTNRVWKVMNPEIEKRAVPFATCPVPLTRTPIIFRLDGSPFLSFFIKTHNHPSRHFLTDAKIADLGKACRWFLETDG